MKARDSRKTYMLEFIIQNSFNILSFVLMVSQN